MSHTQKPIVVVGATGQQGGAVVRPLQASGRFKERTFTRNTAKPPNMADEVSIGNAGFARDSAWALGGALMI